MPCRDGQEEYYQQQALADQAKHVKFLEAALCALLNASGGNVKGVNFKEAGITATELNTWWIQHREKDQQRKNLEAMVAQQAKDRKAALKKLTKAERELLGVKE